MDLDEQLESMESTGETEAEWIDQQTELDDFESDEDEILGPDAAENDLERAYDSFITTNEADYDGWDESSIDREIDEVEVSTILNSEGYHIEDFDIDESQIVEMEIEEGDIKAFIVDKKGTRIGFVIHDENGDDVSYLYVDEDNSLKGVEVFRPEDGVKLDLALGKDDIDGLAEGAEEDTDEDMEAVAEEVEED